MGLSMVDHHWTICCAVTNGGPELGLSMGRIMLIWVAKYIYMYFANFFLKCSDSFNFIFILKIL